MKSDTLLGTSNFGFSTDTSPLRRKSGGPIIKKRQRIIFFKIQTINQCILHVNQFFFIPSMCLCATARLCYKRCENFCVLSFFDRRHLPRLSSAQNRKSKFSTTAIQQHGYIIKHDGFYATPSILCIVEKFCALSNFSGRFFVEPKTQ